MSLPIPSEELKAKLIEENLITSERFDALKGEADRKGQSLLALLASEKVADLLYLTDTIASLLGVALADLGTRDIDEEVLKLIPENVARERQVVLFAREADGTIDAAMLEPNDLETVAYLKEYLKTGVRPYLATNDDLNRGFIVYGSQSNEGFKQIIEENVEKSLRSQKTSEEAAAALPIVAIVDNILSFAVSSRASDIHMEALEDNTLVRYRVDGILKEMIRIPKAVHAGLIARLKILAGLKIDGRFRYQIVSQIVDVRVSVMPTYYGEKVVMRLLESAQKPLSLEELGMLPDTVKIVEDNIAKTYGMIIICGPTGSGKSTTLYGLMNIVNRPNVNIATIEDPIEYNMRFVNQSQVNPQTGITFSAGLRALLRQDPNIIMVGEIRDNETANIAVQAALTGHLLLSSLHTNDAPSAIPRLFDLEIPPFLVASTLNMVFAQRLVRRICASCIYSYDPPQSIKDTVIAQFKAIDIAEPEAKIPKIFYTGKGCAVCANSGYRGRFGIFEVLDVNDTIKKIINTPQFDLEGLTKTARAEGMKTMFEDGIEKVGLGLTTVEEVLRVIRE
jgi:type IV pilus assembly protein PilB